MTNRQIELAKLLERAEITADVGCDHGILSLYLLQHNLTSHLFATDISAPSLAKTEKLLSDFGVSDRATCLVLDGLPLDKYFDQVLIAGMGGNEICKILSRYFDSNKSRPTLVLQPMRDFEKVRKLLNASGYRIIVDRMIFDKKFYLLLKAVVGEQNLSARQLRFGAIEASYSEPDFLRWLDTKIAKTDQILSKIDVFNSKFNELSQFKQECEDLKGCAKC